MSRALLLLLLPFLLLACDQPQRSIEVEGSETKAEVSRDGCYLVTFPGGKQAYRRFNQAELKKLYSMKLGVTEPAWGMCSR